MNVAMKDPIVLDVRSMRIQVRTDRGDGPVLVDDVSLTLNRGEVIGLIGESGAGKSTIGLASMGYTRRDCFIVGGEIVLNGKDVRKMSADERRKLRGPRISYIAQSAAASFNPAMTLMDQVCEASIRHGVLKPAEARAEAISLFKQLDLPDPMNIGDRYPHQVSGGQLQRAMAAMAMVARPDIVVFDEPTTALDVTTQVECLAAFRKLIREHGAAALYITHDLAVVAQIADRIMVLRRGKMVEFGESRQILQAPKEEYTRRLVSERVAGHAFVDTSSADSTPILSIQNVSANYPGKPNVIGEVSLDVRKGDTVAVVGESGSGKSTLARVVMGLLPRSVGDVKFNGVSLPPRLAQRTRDQLRRVQMIYQMPDVALNPQHSSARHHRPSRRLLFPSLEGRSARARAGTAQADGAARGLHHAQDQRAFRRTEAARFDRARARRRAGSDRLRRSDLGARSTRRRGNPAAAEETAGRPRRRLSLHHARSQHGETHRQQGGGDVEGPGGRERPDGADFRAALSPLHRVAAVGGAGDAAGVAR